MIPHKNAVALEGYSTPLRYFHWLMVVVIILMLVTGYLTPNLPDTYEYKWVIREGHESLGLCIIPLVFLRLLIRWFTHTPGHSGYSSYALWLVSRSVHGLFYVLMLVLPMTGYLVALPYGIEFFNVYLINHLPDWLATLLWLNKEPDFYLAGLASITHKALIFGLAGLLVLHIAGAYKIGRHMK